MIRALYLTLTAMLIVYTIEATRREWRLDSHGAFFRRFVVRLILVAAVFILASLYVRPTDFVPLN